MRYKSILLFGAPGSGKGTQGKIIGSIPGFCHTSTGDIFRSLDLSSEMGQTFWEYSSRGQLVPDELTVRLWAQFVKGLELTNQFRPAGEMLVLDGIPRNVEQAKLLDNTIEVVAIIHLVCADLAKMVERLRRRALKENRFDDANDEVIQKRLMVYDIETKPVLDYYPEKLIARVDATMSQIRVLSEIVRVLVPLKEEMDGDATARRRRGAKLLSSPPPIEVLPPAQACNPPDPSSAAPARPQGSAAQPLPPGATVALMTVATGAETSAAKNGDNKVGGRPAPRRRGRT